MNTIHIKKKIWHREYAFGARDNYSRECWCVWPKDLI